MTKSISISFNREDGLSTVVVCHKKMEGIHEASPSLLKTTGISIGDVLSITLQILSVLLMLIISLNTETVTVFYYSCLSISTHLL